MANEILPVTYLARHGETEWSREGRHTGLTDLPLTERGELNAVRLGRTAGWIAFRQSPDKSLAARQTNIRTGGVWRRWPKSIADLVEWNYGDYEGLRTDEIRANQPGWELFRDGCPNGESPADVAARADRVVARVRAIKGNVLIFSSGHFLRVFAARWLGLEPITGKFLMLDTASLSALSYEHDLSNPAIQFWNDSEHAASAV